MAKMYSILPLFMAKRSQQMQENQKSMNHRRVADRILRSLPAVFRNPARIDANAKSFTKKYRNKGSYSWNRPNTETDCC